MKTNKKMYMRTKIIISFIIVAVCVVFLLYSGYTTAATIIHEADPEHYLSSYATFTAILTVIVFGVLGGIAYTIPKQLRKSSENLINISTHVSSIFGDFPFIPNFDIAVF